MLTYLKSIFNFHDRRKQLLLLVLISYLIAFFIARAWSLIVGNSIYIYGFQIHHFYFGAIILTVGSLLALLSEGQKNLRTAACLIGIGVGLFADEIGLLLNCTTITRSCRYAFPDSYDIITTITIGIIFVLILTDLTQKAAQRRLNKKMSGSNE